MKSVPPAKSICITSLGLCWIRIDCLCNALSTHWYRLLNWIFCKPCGASSCNIPPTVEFRAMLGKNSLRWSCEQSGSLYYLVTLYLSVKKSYSRLALVMLSVRRAPLLSTLYPARCMSRSDQWFARVACPISVSDAAISDRSSPPAAGGNHGVPGTQTACSNLDLVDSQAMKPENLAVIGHIGDLLVDIDTTKCDVHLHFTAVLNDSGEPAQSCRDSCSISAVTARYAISRGVLTYGYEKIVTNTIELKCGYIHYGNK